MLFSFDLASEQVHLLWSLVCSCINRHVSIANDRPKWTSWSSSAKIRGPFELWADPRASAIKDQLQAICQRIKYPGSIRRLSEERGRWAGYREEEAFMQNIVDWSKTVDPESWDDDLSPDVLKLFFGWLTFRRALDSNSHGTKQGLLAGMLVQAVFSERLADKSPHIT